MLCLPVCAACYNGNSAVASMDMAEFYAYTINASSWLYFTAAIQVLILAPEAA